MSWKASGYVKALTQAPTGEKLTRSEKLVLLVLADSYNDHEGYAWPSLSRLAEEALMSRRMVCYVLKSLERKGVIARERRYVGPREPTSTAYRLPGLAPEGGSATVSLPSARATALGSARAVAPGSATMTALGSATAVALKPFVNHQGTERERGPDVSRPGDTRWGIYDRCETCRMYHQFGPCPSFP